VSLGSAWPLARSYGAAAKRLGVANLSRRDHAAWTSGAWVRISTPRTSGHRIPLRVLRR